jgi:hypothetical protein
MIAFITSVRHPLHCASYERTGELLDRTLRSVCAQTDGDFTVLVVANRRPAVACPDPRIEFVEVSFPAPGPWQGGRTPLAAVRMDKGTKYVAGLIRARELRADHVMFFDFDDFVHRGIAGFVNGDAAADGWYIDRGYVHWEGSGRITPVEEFHKLCGTSHILACRLFELPPGLERTASREEILEAAGEFYVTKVVGSHIRTAEYFMEKGFALKPLPFPGAIWSRGTGEHVEPCRGFPSFAGRKVTDEIRRDFHLDVPATSFLAELRAGAPQMLPVWREARRQGGLKGAIIETFWKGPLRVLGTLRGKTWKL